MLTARYAFGVKGGVVRGVHKIDHSMWSERRKPDRHWEDDIGKKPRWGFPGCSEARDEIENAFLNTSVKHLFKKSDANSVRFFNCGGLTLKSVKEIYTATIVVGVSYMRPRSWPVFGNSCVV
jgi:hypothetical protein